MAETPFSHLTPAPRQEPVPASGLLSFSEELLWRMERARVESVAFLECPANLSVVARLENHLDVPALRASIDEIVRRHAVLRSRFDDSAGHPVRGVAPATPVPLREIDLRHLSEAEQTPAAHLLLADHVNGPFDLRTGPLLRTALLALREDVHILAITVHHIVFDGGSRRVFVRELGLLYGGYSTGQRSGLPELAASYDDYVAWQRARLKGEVLQRLTQAWMARLDADVELRLPYDRPPYDRSSGVSGACRFTIADAEVEALRTLSRHNGATLAMTTMAVFAAFLHTISGAIDLVIGMPISDRRRREFEEVIGLFTNVMILRVSVAGRPAILEVLKRVRRALADAYAQQDLPYGCFVQARAEATGKPPAAPYRVTFNFMMGTSETRLQMPGLEVFEDVGIGHPPPALADLSLQVLDKGQTLSCALLYNDALFSAQQVQRFAEQFTAMARAVAATPDCPIVDISPIDVHLTETASVR